ncbi:Pyruvate:ferredoxin oxidoreductase or related 2-oxoacid:ferredoxin oxidoreductase, alpha subunit [Halalkaliarchaeum sp. AArc-CO]|uniref:2-oxoacid:acceptor oxidoreductase subunit alpha n=1 Tax=Halalkaliarchaeum sp. AArc-CO TaxID=2866381 RepID=UPI00217D5692|nr:2-oxoacid:acceptor oxidoreductase subunit alpha [Halalkaliarchaeum sp. AArc-CO]UWG49543.1 Pyruvate:ferredoxin oxidoreductase or related 2-oxoacid:ferredoxin oxidoreductase, alpha subunit [Halalkaliarchaeum sp. AArc-CO]
MAVSEEESDEGSADEPEILTGDHFMMGDTACAEGAIAAGCRFFAGYPITPASEVAERISQRFPGLPGAQYIQMEDEIASMAAVVGGSNAGKKSMTATSGPGISLMNENLGLAAMTESPCVIVNVQRGGPSTGMPTLPGQGDVMQARYGSQGDYPMIAYAPSSPQEMFDLTVEAFNAAERYRTPVIVLADQTVGHMTGKVSIPDSVETVDRPRPDDEIDPETFRPYDNSVQVPPMAAAGDGGRVHVTGLTHDERGHPDIDVETHETMLGRMMDKVDDNREEICRVERYRLDDADVALIAYGSMSRSAHDAVDQLRGEGVDAGLLRVVTPWPFPIDEIEGLSTVVDRIVVAEMNLGQYVTPVRAHADCPVDAHTHPGGAIPRPDDVADTVREVIR